MSTTILISGQMLIDIVILILLVWLIKVSGNRANPGESKVDDLQAPEALVREMREIAVDLEKNLEQKRTLSRDVLARLEDELEQAEAYVRRMEKINEACGHQLRERTSDSNNRDRTRSSIQSLLAKGFSRDEIAQHLGIPLGEIELLIKLQPNTAE